MTPVTSSSNFPTGDGDPSTCDHEWIEAEGDGKTTIGGKVCLRCGLAEVEVADAIAEQLRSDNPPSHGFSDFIDQNQDGEHQGEVWTPGD